MSTVTNSAQLQDLIRDDAYAASFQSVGQYRQALLKVAASLEQQVEQEPVGHDWDDQDKCRRCGNRDWYAGPVCIPSKTPTPPAAPDTSRTDREIVDQTEELAALLLSRFHQRVLTSPILFRESDNPLASACWSIACEIQELLTGTDPGNAVAEIEDAALSAHREQQS